MAGDPSAPINRYNEVLHCGGYPVDREGTPYISCSSDLFWCLWSVTTALLQGKANLARIYFIANGSEYQEHQSQVCRDNDWDGLELTALMRMAKARAVSASETLVHRGIGRERIMKILKLDLEVLQGATELGWVCDIINELLDRSERLGQNAGNYFDVSKLVFADSRWTPEKLTEWCEANSSRLKCTEKLRRCVVRPLYQGLIYNYERVLSKGCSLWEKDAFREHLVDAVYIPAHEYIKWHEEIHWDHNIDLAIEEHHEREWEYQLYSEPRGWNEMQRDYEDEC